MDSKDDVTKKGQFFLAADLAPPAKPTEIYADAFRVMSEAMTESNELIASACAIHWLSKDYVYSKFHKAGKTLGFF